MHIETAGIARVRDRDTGIVYEIDAEELDWDTVSADEAQMGIRTQWEAEIEHEQLGTLSWTVWEYPSGAFESVDHDLNGHHLVSDFNISLEHDPEDSDDDAREDVEWADVPQAQQVEEIVAWFNSFFEDPQNEMPYADKESDDNYEYPYGGPYDAAEEITAEFEGKATTAAIEAAIQEVTSDGTFDWAPTSQHPDRRDAERDYYDEPDDLDDDELDGATSEDRAHIEELDQITVPAQLPGPLITFERDGRVALQRSPSALNAWANLQFRESAHAGILEALDDFEQNFPGDNHPALGRTLGRLRVALGHDPADLDVVRLGIAAERIKQYAARADDIFIADMAAEVAALDRNLERNLSHFDEWSEYIHGVGSDPDPSGEVLDAAQQIVSSFIQADALESDVREEIEAELLPVTMSLEGENGTSVERKAFVRSVHNIVATSASAVVKYLSTAAKNVVEGHMEAYKDLGKLGTFAGLTAGATVLYVMAQTHPLFAFVAPILAILKSLIPKG